MRKLFAYRLAGMFAFIVLGISVGFGQHHEGHIHELHPVHQIERAANAGELSAEQAILQKFRALYAPKKLDPAFRFNNNHSLKCFTPAIIEYEKLREKLSDDTVREIELLQQQATANTTGTGQSYNSPSGRFIIHYETSGNHAVPAGDENTNGIPDYVEKAGEYADAAYEKEIEQLGFTDPIPTGSQYNIHIRNSSAYGFTQTSSSEPAGTFIVVENDYNGFPPNTDPEGDQLGALKVTMAHELKHAIQFIQNGWNGETDLWAEMDATLMEEVVYDQVNDYYNYIYDLDFGTPLFQTPTSTLLPINGNSFNYEDITWALYFHERFGDNFWPAAWSRIENSPSISLLDAVRTELESRGENYFHTLAESYIWHYAGGQFRSATNYGFDEREEYPEPLISESFTGIPDEPTAEKLMEPVSADFFEVLPQTNTQGDVEIIVNSNSNTAHLAIVAYFLDNSVLSSFAEAGGNEQTYLRPGWRWKEIERLGIAVVSSNESTLAAEKTKFSLEINSIETTSKEDEPAIPGSISLSQNYPNPFNPSTVIQFQLPREARVALNVYDVNGRLIQTVADRTFGAGLQQLTFDGSNLSSGVYIYELRSGDVVRNRKMLLIK